MHDESRARLYDLYGGVLRFNEWIGIRYVRSHPEGSRVLLPWSPRIAGPDGAIGPGMLAGVADIAAGHVSVSALDWRAQVATVSLALNICGRMPAGEGIVGEGRVISSDGGTVLVDVRMSSDGPDPVLVASARLRMIAIARRDVPDQLGSYPATAHETTGPFLGPGDLVATVDGETATSTITPRPHFMGNSMRGALHGGFMAASLFETLAALGRAGTPAFAPLDGLVQFLRPGRGAEMAVTVRMTRGGARVGFASGVIEQATADGTGPVATLTATLGR